MAKKRNRNRARPRPVGSSTNKPDTPDTPEKPAEPPVREPAFWFGFEVTWAKLVTARVVVFGLLAIDALLQIRHAPRYGAGDFNVGQLPGLDWLAPGRSGYEVAQLLAGYLFVLVACGVATRVLVPIVATIYAWLYLGSQLDSYQHHYLVALVLVIASFVPWERPEEGGTVRSWALRLLLVQLAIVYLWAAISKMQLQWVNGRTLGAQLTGTMRSLVDHTVGLKVASVLVMVVELTLAVTVWLRRTWIVAAPLGIALHVGIIASKLEIGLFAYLMLGLYVLVVPDRVWVTIAELPAVEALGRRLRAIGDSRRWYVWAAGVVVGIAIALLTRFENALTAAVLVTIVTIAIGVGRLVRRNRRVAVVGVAHLVAIGMWWMIDRTTSVTSDYYRFWAGSQRRLGNASEAERALRTWIDNEPDEGAAHYQLGRVLLAQDRADDGIAELHRAQQLEPTRARAWLEEARWLARQGKTDEAIAKAREAAFAEPSSGEARALIGSLSSGRGAGSGAVRPDDDDVETP
jgi:hypothetical protein